MANTENIEAKLCAYIDGDLDAAGRAEIEKHLAANPQHRGLIEQLSRQRDLLRELPRESAPEEIIDALQSQMERSVLLGDVDTGAEAEALKIHRWPQLLAAAAIVLLTVGLGAVIYFVLPRGASTGDYARVTESGATLDAATGSTESETADGSAGPADDSATGMLGKSAARAESVATAPAAPDAPLPSVAMAPQDSVSDALMKEKAADPFAPARAGARESEIASNELVDAQYRLQNADLARQLKDAPGGLQDNAMFVVVSTADPSATRSEVTNYLASNKIAWESVLQPMPEPIAPVGGQDVNFSRAQSLNVQMKQGSAQAGQQAAPREEELEKKEAAKNVTASGAGVAAAGDSAGSPQDGDERAKDLSAPAQGRVQSGVADAGATLVQESATLTNTIPPDEGLLQATTQAQQQQQPELQEPLQSVQQPGTSGRAAPASRLIIARGMTKQQAAELSSNLSKQTAVQRAALYEQRPVPAAAAPAVRRRAFSGDPTATTAPVTAIPPAALAEELATIPTTNLTTTGTDEDRLAANAAPATQEAATPTTTTAPAPIPLGTGESFAVADPTTQEAGPVEERVDVVILVEDDVPPAAPTETEQAVAPSPPGEVVPTTAPSTQESSANQPLP